MKGKQYLVLALVFALGFAAAVVLVRPSSAEAPTQPEATATAARETGPESVLRTEDVRDFFKAVTGRDFAAMAAVGERTFVRGARVENADKLLSGYETNSFPPFTVYALYVENMPEKTRRVLLTLDKEDRVESFLAEEMTIIK